jgi:5-formyltetrahydrofolate cyclo-ligase
MDLKDDLRQLIKFKKQSLTINEIQKKSIEICSLIEHNLHFNDAAIVVSYWPLSKEVNLIDLNNKYCCKKTILLPVIEHDEIILKQYSENSLLIDGPLGIKVPVGDVFTDVQSIDLVLVPGVAFDQQNNRLGRGKGFYDRFLKKINAYKIGVCYQFQLFGSIPTTKDDIKVDEIIMA